MASQAVGAGLPAKPGQKDKEARALPMLLSSRAGLSAVAGPRMRESPSTPAAMQSLLRYFHPSWAGRSRVASAEKHLCARGTALWTHIRNLVCKGKVGCGGLRRPQGCIGAGSLLPGCQLRSPVLGSRGKRGSVVTALWEEREGHLLQNMLVSLSKTLSGCADSPFPGVQEEQRLPLSSWSGGHGAPVYSPHLPP